MGREAMSGHPRGLPSLALARGLPRVLGVRPVLLPGNFEACNEVGKAIFEIHQRILHAGRSSQLGCPRMLLGNAKELHNAAFAVAGEGEGVSNWDLRCHARKDSRAE